MPFSTNFVMSSLFTFLKENTTGWYNERKAEKVLKLSKDSRFIRSKYRYPMQHHQDAAVEAYLYQIIIDDKNQRHPHDGLILKLIQLYYAYELLRIGNLPKDVVNTSNMIPTNAVHQGTAGTWNNYAASNFMVASTPFRIWNKRLRNMQASEPSMYEIFHVDLYKSDKYIRDIHEYTNIDEYIAKYSKFAKYDPESLPFPTLLVLNIKVTKNVQLIAYCHMTHHLIGNWRDNEACKLFSKFMHGDTEDGQMRWMGKLYHTKAHMFVTEPYPEYEDRYHQVDSYLGCYKTYCELRKYSQGEVFYIAATLGYLSGHTEGSIVDLPNCIADIGVFIAGKGESKGVKQDMIAGIRLNRVNFSGRAADFPAHFGESNKINEQKYAEYDDSCVIQ